MIKINNLEIFGLKSAVYGMRLPLRSHHKADTIEETTLGVNDLDLAKRLIKAGTEHRKFLRQIHITMNITAPQYWWREAETYKVGTTANSSSFMHTAMKRPFKLIDFSSDYLIKDIKYVDMDTSFEEIWKEIDESDKIHISNHGRVKYLEYKTINKKGNIRVNTEYIKSEFSINSSGYKKLSIKNEDKTINLYIHRLLAKYFIENPNNLPYVNHIDGNKVNNNLNNLEWCTASENARHAYANNLSKKTEYNNYKKIANRRFDEIEVVKIKQMFDDGYNKKEISLEFDCCDSIIGNILNGKSYKEFNFNELDVLKINIDKLNELRNLYLETNDKSYWESTLQILPQSYNYERIITCNMEVLYNMYNQRKTHKLREWREFCQYLEQNELFKQLFLEQN